MTIISPSCADLQVNSFAGVDFNTAGCTWEQLTHATEMMRTTRCSVTIPLSPGQLSINC
jgi:N-acetylglucosamine-6-phosphate deacetylase